MKRMKLTLVAAMAALGLLVCTVPARAARVLDPAVSGLVTALPGPEQVAVDGKIYNVQTVAIDTLRTLHVGDHVDLYLDGPVTSSLSKVVMINAHK